MSPQKQALKAYLDAFKHPGNLQDSATRAFFAPDAQINVAHPFNEISGAEGFIEHFLNPLRQAFQGLYRRDYIAMGGTFEGQEWVTCTGHYVGHFANPWIGIKPTGMLTWLRVGEFHRIENGQAVESYVYLDIPELIIATGQWPIKESPGVDRGYVGMLPGPASQDGLQWHENDPAVGHNSISFTTTGLATNAAFNNLSHTFAGNDAYGWAFSARTGGATEDLIIDNLRIVTVPEPSGLALVGLGLAGLVLRRRR